MDKRQRRAEGLWEQVLRESEKHNVMFLFRSQEEALSTANDFREAMSENVKDTADKTTLKTMAGSYIYFKDIQFLKKGWMG